MIIKHRVNTIEELKRLPTKYGVEIDIRHNSATGGLYLNHDPAGTGDDFEEYLSHFKHAFMIINIKDSGTEDRCIALVEKQGISEYFLLDVEFPYIYAATRRSPPVTKIAMRYSEDEPIEQALKYKGKADWVLIDTNTRLPLDEHTVEQLKGFKTCLVSPDRWGRPDDIPVYAEKMKRLGFKLDMVFTKEIEAWEATGLF